MTFGRLSFVLVVLLVVNCGLSLWAAYLDDVAGMVCSVMLALYCLVLALLLVGAQD